MEPRRNTILIYSTITIPVIIITGMLFIIARLEHKKSLSAVTNEVAEVIEAIPTPPPKPFPIVEIKAKAAYVFDATERKILFAKDAETAFPLASITKLMTAYVAAKTAPLYSLITIDDDALKAEGDSGLRPNEIWKLQDLIDFTLTVSSNDGARAIANAIGNFQVPEGPTTTPSRGREHFISLMNNEAKNMGLLHTTFFNETGLDLNSTTPGASGSAEDVAKLMTYLLMHRPELLSATRKEKIEVQSGSLITHNASNTNEVMDKIPDLIASKTGYTDLAGGNLVIAFSGSEKPSHTVIIVVLGSTLEGRFQDTETLALAVEKYLSPQ